MPVDQTELFERSVHSRIDYLVSDKELLVPWNEI